ncbi:MAG: MBL fold metallo-hydrolase [Deltaproteobacteria bacterium]|nr:MBL fold metallo-hydrolase [Deltaproteobacteria bacterium]
MFADLWRFRLPIEAGINHTNVYLIREKGGWCVFDTGMDTSTSRNLWSAALSGPLDGSIRRIIVSHHHPDHLGLAAWLGNKTYAPVYIRPEELSAFQFASLADPADETALREFFRNHGMPATEVDRTIAEFRGHKSAYNSRRKYAKIRALTSGFMPNTIAQDSSAGRRKEC